MSGTWSAIFMDLDHVSPDVSFTAKAERETKR